MRRLVLLLLPWPVLLANRVAVVGEVLGIFLPTIAVVAALWGIRSVRRGREGRAVLAASLALVAVIGSVLPLSPLPQPAPVAGLVLASANLTSSNDGSVAAAGLIARSPDVLVTVETPRAPLQMLQARYANHVSGGPYALGGVNVFSDLPLTVLPSLPGTGLARSVVVAVGGPTPFTLVAAHIPRPWVRTFGLVRPRRGYEATPVVQQRLLRTFADGIAALEGPVVLAGDLNANDRGHGYRLLTQGLTDVMRSTWAAATSTKPAYIPLMLRIDHILVGGGWCGRSLGLVPLPGSDHDGIQAEIGPCPP